MYILFLYYIYILYKTEIYAQCIFLLTGPGYSQMCKLRAPSTMNIINIHSLL